jgi:hypothetical protein
MTPTNEVHRHLRMALGWFLLLAPFMALFVFVVASIGLVNALLLYGGVMGLTLCVVTGLKLTYED